SGGQQHRQQSEEHEGGQQAQSQRQHQAYPESGRRLAGTPQALSPDGVRRLTQQRYRGDAAVPGGLQSAAQAFVLAWRLAPCLLPFGAQGERCDHCTQRRALLVRNTAGHGVQGAETPAPAVSAERIKSSRTTSSARVIARPWSL